MSIHKLIRDGRARLHLTEQEFADKVGVSRGAVQQWEKEGGTAPTRKNQPAVAALLSMSVAQLMSGGQKPECSQSMATVDLSGELQPNESERLRERFIALKNETGVGQADFARRYGVPGGASMVSQHIMGHRPISLEAAFAYSKGFGCGISEISEQIAQRINDATGEKSVAFIQTPTDLGSVLEAFRGYLADSDEDHRGAIAALLGALAKNPGDQRIFDSLQLMMTAGEIYPD